MCLFKRGHFYIRMGSESSEWSLWKRKERDRYKQEERRPCDHRCGDQSGVRQRNAAATEARDRQGGCFPGPCRGHCPPRTDFTPSLERRECISVVLSHPVCGDLVWQPQETSAVTFPGVVVTPVQLSEWRLRLLWQLCLALSWTLCISRWKVLSSSGARCLN